MDKEYNSVRDAILNDSAFKAARKTKKKMDKINYGGLYKEYSEGNPFFLEPKTGKQFVELEPKEETDINEESRVYKCYEELKKQISGVNIGVISNGVHGLDLISKYFSIEEIKDIEWSDKKVMLVYEAPSNNLNWSFAYKKRNCSDVSELLNDYDDIKFGEKLTRNWWRLDSSFLLKDLTGFDRLSKKGEYCSLPLFLIKQFGLCNLYITNVCRFEFFESNEKFLKWNELEEHGAIEIAYEKLFKRELDEFSPNIILATASPFNLLADKMKNQKEKYDLVKIIHPTNPTITSEHRLACNTCYIAKELFSKGIVEKDEANKVIESYLNPKEK